MNFDLAAMVRRMKNSRRAQADIRPIAPTAAMAANLYQQVYRKVILAWAGQLERILVAYTRSLPTKLTTDSADDLQAALNAAEAWLNQLILTITPALRDWAVRTEKWQRGKWIGAVLSATGIDLGTILTPDDVNDTIEAFLARNVGLVRSVSDETRHRISDIVLRNYQQRIDPRQVAREMNEAAGLGRARSLRIAADQSSKLSNRLDQARHEQAGIKRYTWRHSFKRHPRLYHVERNGHVFEWGKPPSDGPPGTQPFCGCRAQALLEFGNSQ